MVITYYGENSPLIQEKLAELTARYQAKYASGLNFWRFDLESDIASLKSAASSQSMFEEKKLILVGGVLSAAEERWQELEMVLSGLAGLDKSQEVILVLYSFLVGEKSKKRIDFLKKLGEAKEFKPFDKPKLAEWCLKKAGEADIKISKADMAYLINGVGPDGHRVWNEVLKLAAYGQGTVSKKDIDNLVEFEVFATNFKVTDALMQKNVPLALQGLAELWQKNEDPILVVGALAWQFRILVKLAGDKISSAGEAVSKLKLNPWVAQKSLSALKNFSWGELKNIHQNLADVDLAIKTGEADGREALADFVYGFLKL